jgi:hypothetical protein
MFSDYTGPILLKRFVAGLFCFLSPVALAQDANETESTGRLFFPRDWVRGFVDAAIAPPHNELDLNRCASTAGRDGGVHARCAAFARYAFTGYIELRPIAAGPLSRILLFAQPEVYLGRNIPQFAYTKSASPMAFASEIGAAIQFPKNFEIRFTTHHVHWIGRYNSYLGKEDMGKTGPFGQYATISGRWYFGGYGGRN